MLKLLDGALALIGLQRVKKTAADRDQVIADMWRKYGELGADEFAALREKWRAEFVAMGKLARADSGCGHGLVRFPYERDFTPCHCKPYPRDVVFSGTTLKI